jgi:zinc transport system ATP-binding protein
MPTTHSLVVHCDGDIVFSSDGHWLHPLFELETFLGGWNGNPARLAVTDKIVGRAAALLIVRLGVGRVHAGLLSRLGREALEQHHLPHTWDRLVDRIVCRTEELLAGEHDPERAHEMLRRRAGYG